MGIHTQPDGTVVNQGAFEGDSSVLELGTGTAAQINAAIALVPLAQRTHRVVRAGISDANPATLNLPVRPVGSELLVILHGGNAGSILAIQEDGVALATNSPTAGNVAFAVFGPDAAGANTHTIDANGITTAGVGTVCALFRKIRANSAAGARDGWICLSFFNIAAT